MGSATFFSVFLVTLSPFAVSLQPWTFTVGVIGGPEDDPRQNTQQFWSFGNNYTNLLSLVPVVANVRWWDTREVTRAICDLLEKDVDSLLSFAPPEVGPVLVSYARSFEIPVVTSSFDRPPESRFIPDIKLIPNSNQAIADIIKYYKWKNFVFFYDNDDGPIKLQEILRLTNHQIDVEAIWKVNNGEESRRVLQYAANRGSIPNSDTRNVLFATHEHLLDEVVNIPEYSKESPRKYHFILTEPTFGAPQRYIFKGSLVTKLTLVEQDSQAFRTLENRWITLLPPYQQPTPGAASRSLPKNLLLTFDATSLMSKSLSQAVQESILARRENGTKQRMKCMSENKDEPVVQSQNGIVISNFIKTIVLENGITGNIKFNPKGERTDFTFGVIERSVSIKKVATWSDSSGLKILDNKKPSKELKDDPVGKTEENRESRETLIVTSTLVKPFLMLSDTKGASGNDRYYGFVKDLLDQLSSNQNFAYEIRLVKDGRYGSFINGEWNGMIGEIIREEADIAVAPLTVTRIRSEVVDFTLPFMSFGLNILIKKTASSFSEKHSIALLTPFGFFTAFAYDTWLVLIAVYFVISVALFAVSRFTGVPDRIRSVDTKGSDRLSLCSSFWFAAGSLFLRSTAIYPRSLSHRVISIVWWAFTLVTVIICICSLSSLFIIEKTKNIGIVDLNIGSLQLLKKSMETGSPKIGVLRLGSTQEFFMSSEIGLYRDFGIFLQNNPNVRTNSYGEAAARVRSSNGSFAFVMESPVSEHQSNIEPCDVVATSGYLDVKAHSIVVKKGSLLKELFDHGLLEMMETGVLRQVYEKWWHSETACDDPFLDILHGIYSSSLTLNEVSGVFYLLIIGIVVASIVAAAEYFIRSKQISVDK